MKKFKTMLVAFLGLSLVACGGTDLKLVNDDKGESIKEIKHEYTGDDIEIKFTDFIDNLDKLEKEQLIDSTEIQASTVTYDKDKEEVAGSSIVKIETDKDVPYFKVKELGTYKVKMNYNKKDYEVSIVVEDTTAPTFENKDKDIEVEVNATKEEVIAKIETKDLTPVKVDFDDSSINYQEEGEYNIKCTATDANKNKAEQEYKLVIKGNTDEETAIDNDSDNVATLPQTNTGHSNNGNTQVNTNTPSTGGTVEQGSGNNSGGVTTPPVEPVVPVTPVTPEPDKCAVYLGNDGNGWWTSMDAASNWADTQAITKGSAFYLRGFYVYENSCGAYIVFD